MKRFILTLAIILCASTSWAWQVVGSGVAGGAPWTPAALYSGGTFGMWYDPSDLSTLFQDSAGTTAVTATGQSVCRVNDKSGNGVHLTQTTSTKCPTLQSDSGKNYLSFDGGDVLIVPVNLSEYNKFTSVVGIYSVSSATQVISEYTTSGYTVSGGFTAGMIRDSPAGSFSLSAKTNFGDVARSNDQTFSSGKSLVTASIDVTVASSVLKFVIRRNGVVQALTSLDDAGAIGAAFASDSLYIGGSGSTPTSGLSGRIYGYIAMLNLMESNDVSASETWMNEKTGAY